MKRIVLSMAAALALAFAYVAPSVAAGYKVDPIHSGVTFRVKHLGVGYIHGRFDKLGGTFTFDDKNSADMTFEMQVPADSIDTNNAGRDRHLRGPDFFNVKEFPAIAFKSTEVKPAGENTYDVAGDLTMHGVTKPIHAKIEHVGTGKDPRGGVRCGFEATFTINRSDFEMKNMLQGIGDEIRVIVAFEGVPQ